MSGAVPLEGFHCVKHALRFAPELVLEVRVRDLDRALALAARLAPDVAGAPRAVPAFAGQKAARGVVGGHAEAM